MEVILTQSSLREQAIETLNDEELHLFKKTEQPLEETVQATGQNIGSKDEVTVFEDNSLAAYGVNYENMSCFRGKGHSKFAMNDNLLRQIWHGLNYAEIPDQNIGVPPQFLSAMNTFEILSLYRAFARLLENGNVPTGKDRETISKEELKTMPAEMVISKMVGYGCKHAALWRMRERGWTYFPTRRNDLIKRIRAFSPETKNNFIRLLDNPKRNIELKVAFAEFGVFYNPVYDGASTNRRVRNMRGPIARRKYCQAISYFLNELYKGNIQHK